jgi:hypothetical protein
MLSPIEFQRQLLYSHLYSQMPSRLHSRFNSLMATGLVLQKMCTIFHDVRGAR